MQDYYSHNTDGGYDFRDQERVAKGVKGKYGTHLFADRAKQIIAHQSTSQVAIQPFKQGQVTRPNTF